MAINSYFYNAIVDGQGNYDRVYNAEDVTSYLDKIVGNGVFPNPSTQLQVRAGTGMQVIVADGQGWIKGHKLINTADLALSIDQSDPLLSRIDRVIFYSDSSTRTMGITVLKGTPAVSPVVTPLTRTTTRYEMCLANIKINKQITSISNSMITDTRPNSSVCGWVQGLIQQVDTSSLFVQWDTAYAEFFEQLELWKRAQQEAFQQWLDNLTGELQVGAYIRAFTKVVNGRQSATTNVVKLNMDGYTYDVNDIIIANLNGLVLVEGEDYVMNTAVTPVEMHLNAEIGTVDIFEVLVLKSMIGTPVDLDGDATYYPVNDN